MPEWVRKTFSQHQSSLEDIAIRTRRRFQTRRWEEKQNAMKKYIDTGEATPGLLELV